jgi:hypothetical protein
LTGKKHIVKVLSDTLLLLVQLTNQRTNYIVDILFPTITEVEEEVEQNRSWRRILLKVVYYQGGQHGFATAWDAIKPEDRVRLFSPSFEFVAMDEPKSSAFMSLFERFVVVCRWIRC